MDPSEHRQPRQGISRGAWVLLGFLAVAAYFLFSEHRAHFLGYLPLLLVAACPLMHLFHRHGGHGGRGTRHALPNERETNAAPGSQHTHQEGGNR